MSLRARWDFCALESCACFTGKGIWGNWALKEARESSQPLSTIRLFSLQDKYFHCDIVVFCVAHTPLYHLTPTNKRLFPNVFFFTECKLHRNITCQTPWIYYTHKTRSLCECVCGAESNLYSHLRCLCLCMFYLCVWECICVYYV